MANYKMKPGSKQKDTPGGFNQKQSDTISKLGKSEKRGVKEMIKIRTKPDKIDSLAVHSRNKYRKEFGVDANATDIANEAERRFGKIDVSSIDKPGEFDKRFKGVTSSDFYNKRKEYGLGIFKKKN